MNNPKQKNKLTKEEYKLFQSLVWGFMGWTFLFNLLFIGVFVYAIIAFGYETEVTEIAGLAAIMVLNFVALAICGFWATHLVLKKRIKKERFLLLDGITFQQLRKAVLVRWLWISIATQIGVVSLILLVDYFYTLPDMRLAGVWLVIQAYIFMYVCQHYYKKLFTIPNFAPAEGTAA